VQERKTCTNSLFLFFQILFLAQLSSFTLSFRFFFITVSLFFLPSFESLFLVSVRLYFYVTMLLSVLCLVFVCRLYSFIFYVCSCPDKKINKSALSLSLCGRIKVVNEIWSYNATRRRCEDILTNKNSSV